MDKNKKIPKDFDFDKTSEWIKKELSEIKKRNIKTRARLQCFSDLPKIEIKNNNNS